MKSLTSIKEIFHTSSCVKECINDTFNSLHSSKNIAQIHNANGSFLSVLIWEICSKAKNFTLQTIQYQNSSKKDVDFYSYSNDFIIVVPTDEEAVALYTDFDGYDFDAEKFIFPSWGTVSYKSVSLGSVIFGKRAAVLSEMANKCEFSINSKPRIFIFTQKTFLQPLPSPAYIKSLCFSLHKGDSFDTAKIAQRLIQMQYTRVSKVAVRGEFSLRGEVLDIFLPGQDNPVRILFDFDRIESFKEFSAENQTTIKSLEKILIYPMKEILWTEELIQKTAERLDEYQKTSVSASNSEDNQYAENSIHLPFTQKALEEKDRILSSLSASFNAQGEELFFQFTQDKIYTVKDYFDDSTITFFINYDKQENSKDVLKRETEKLYRLAREELPVLPPHMAFLDFNKTEELFKNRIYFRTIIKENENQFINAQSQSERSFFGNINFMKEELQKLQDDSWKIYIFTDNENQMLRIHEIFKDFIDLDNADNSRYPVTLIPNQISAGFSISELKLLVIQENEIFGRRKYIPKSVNKAKSQAIDTFVDLTPGDYVVHVNWGIGLFHGIERVKSFGNERDYIKLEYADKEIAFVPIEQVNMVQRYIGNEGDNPRLDRIGSKSWENRKNKVKKVVEDIAQKLIDLYSRRLSSVGYAFPKETEWQAAFEAAFPYEDTPDQISVTQEIKEDMEKPVPMDRLVCGDVGYGKTEIAMRAAFKAVMGGKQVAFLAPTTILCEQHYETCKERFKNFPVKIERLSRFVAPAEQKKILQRLADGKIDIIVGTHRIIQKDVIFKKLGLMIIDEEQRFGVKDKEKLKVMKNNIDCLTMSATPIPRTLHMSLLKIRDMSLLTTPPQNRQPIETVVDEFTEERVTAAIRKEIERGGQVFYLHNRVESLEEIRHKIELLVPEVIVDVAHGQMSATQLEDIFQRFKMGGFHVLIATTIIENGIDIPNVNTIIIDRADMYGVSQLYQLRGRVGRSDRQAYAYLLYPENKALSEVAMKRLQVISDFTELGSGFKIAMKDMEIRGAGNLLGRDQSGDVYSVGFDMYMRLLNDAVNRLTLQNDYKEQNEVLMELEYTGFIPDSYIINPQIKMEIYKKIAAVTEDEEFDAVLGELSDRFGPIPEEVSSLLALAEIRIICKKLSIKSIKERNGEVAVEFLQVSNLSVDKILKLIKDNPSTVKLNPSLPNVIFIKLGKIGLKEKSEFIREKLSQLQ
ncbi:MAG: transcription-repair coupling factor [Spirochaetales bacterium]|nr:transcription-repair coupling factor [Spirochaetales bacterium]